MFSVLFLFSVFYVGYLLTKKINASFILGSLISVTSIYIFLYIFQNLLLSLALYAVGFLVVLVLTIKESFREIREKFNLSKLFIYSVLFLFSFFLFEKSFSYDGNFFLIQSNLYQDFGGRISNIRYFSNGGFIPEVPYFADGGVLYHFMFEFYAGILEFLGARIDFAFNIISALSLASLAFLLFEFGSSLFRSKMVGFLTPFFFIFISDLSFFNLFQKYGFSLSSFYHNNTYVLGNLMGTEIGRNFLNINTYLNQRHLIFALSAFLLIIYSIFFQEEKKINRTIFLSFLIAILPFWHLQILLAVYIFLGVTALLFINLRTLLVKIIVFSLILVVPQLLIIKLNSLNQILFNPGFTIADKLTPNSFLLFWVWNLGFAIPIFIFGFLKSDSFQRKIFLCFFSLFFIANLFQFSRDIFDNHKFFNIFYISVSLYSAFAIYSLFKKSFIFKVIAVFGVILMTISGFFHFLVVKNDVYAKVPDSLKTDFGKWIKNNTTPRDIIFTNGEIYDPASLSGRRIFLGRSHYIFLFGGDPSKRINDKNIILAGNNDKLVDKIISRNKITYIIVYKNGAAPNSLDANTSYLDENFKKVYEDNRAVIYKI